MSKSVINEALIALSIKKLKEEISLLKRTPKRGRQGIPGLDGVQGEQGLRGPQGLIGEQGIPGIKGDKGIKGDHGDKGIQGEQGLQGLIGEQGLQGLQGTEGEKGDIGERGLQGYAGPRGYDGEKGDKGEEGSQGSQGLQGFKGETGPQGERGLIGEQGIQGLIGPQGLQGLIGEQGEKGLRGLTGPIGPSGKDGKDGIDAKVTFDDIKPVLEDYTTKKDYKKFVDTTNTSLRKLGTYYPGGGGGLGEKDVIAIAKQYGGGDGTDVDLSAVAQHIIPATDSSYDLGTASKKWRDLHLSGSSIFLGESTIKSEGGSLKIMDPGGNEIKRVLNNTTTIPTGDLRNTEGDTDNRAREDDGGSTLGSRDRDEFGADLRTQYDCLEPHGQFKSLDYGAGEAHVGA